jgi:hypothetical protein
VGERLLLLVRKVDLGRYLDAIVLARLCVRGKHEAELEVLTVWKLLSVQCEAAVQFARPWIHIGVFLEELKLHRIALGVINSAGSDDIIDLDISRWVACGFLLALEPVGEAELGKLSNHSVFF